MRRLSDVVVDDAQADQEAGARRRPGQGDDDEEEEEDIDVEEEEDDDEDEEEEEDDGGRASARARRRAERRRKKLGVMKQLDFAEAEESAAEEGPEQPHLGTDDTEEATDIEVGRHTKHVTGGRFSLWLMVPLRARVS